MRCIINRSAFLAAGLFSAIVLPATAAPGPVTLQPFVSGLSAPVEITHANDFSGRLFVVEQAGRIRIVKNGALVSTPFLDIRSSAGGPVLFAGEMGLLGLAFHPSYASNGRFYVFYTRVLQGDSAGNEIVVARYQRSAANPDLADAASGSIVITAAHPSAQNHNGGKVAFGPDGYLYISIGDGGGGGDPFQTGQSLAELRGKLLRIDIDGASPYAIPPTNPFASSAVGIRKEIWAYGLRNPFRFTFDRDNGDLYIGDVGQANWEEIDYQPAGDPGGRNYGWSVFEGTHCYPPVTVACSLSNHTPPVIEYDHGSLGGNAVIGGYRYRGHKVQEIYGYYIYGDDGSGRIWAATVGGPGPWPTVQIATGGNISAFGQDEAGELYVADVVAGTVKRFAPVDTDGDGLSDAWELANFGSTTGASASADTDGDGLTNLREYEERTNPNVKDNDVFANARLFAMQQYRDFLSREADLGGLDSWIKFLGTGGTRSQLANAFLGSSEFQGVVAPVTRLYFAYFLRIPDYGGLQYWIGQMRAGMALTTISQAFATSPEFTSRYGSQDNAQFVTQVYQNVLNRAPDSGGFAYWTGQLNGGMLTRGQVMLAFSESPEFVSVIGNEVYVTMTYVGMLRRAPDSGGFQFWVNQLDMGGSGVGLIDGFLSTPEYHNRFLP